MVIAPASTGSDSRSRQAVTSIAQPNILRLFHFLLVHFILASVVIKFIARSMEDRRARWSPNIAKSTVFREWPIRSASGGYIVHPVPTPFSTTVEKKNIKRAGGSSQKLRLFSLGKAISGEWIRSGINQFPNPPIIRGIIRKKTIISPWLVITMFYTSRSKNISSNRSNRFSILII